LVRSLPFPGAVNMDVEIHEGHLPQK